MAKLLVKSATDSAQSFHLKLGTNRLGRGDFNDFSFNDATVSSRHCEIVLESDAIRVRDLDSTNGTFIDGRPIKESTLMPGQTLKLGAIELELESAEVNIAIPRMDRPVETPSTPNSEPACVHHSVAPAAWRCSQCAVLLCERCVHHVSRVGGAALNLCPDCGGRCVALTPDELGRPAGRRRTSTSFWRQLRDTLKMRRPK